MSNAKSKTRIIAFAFLACFLVIFILSSAFILTHVDHEHDHNGVNGSCATCAQILSAENILKQFSTALLGVLFAIAELYAAIGILKAIAVYASLSTPITLKIKMNN